MKITKRQYLKDILLEVVDDSDGITTEIKSWSNGDTFLVSFDPDFDRMDLSDICNDVACHLLNCSDFEIVDQDNINRNLMVKVLDSEMTINKKEPTE